MIGHNSIPVEQLRSLVERIEQLEERKKRIADIIRDVYSEAKSNDYDVKALREIIRLRRQDAKKRAEHEAIVEGYKHALGMLIGSPLGDWAIHKVGSDATQG